MQILVNKNPYYLENGDDLLSRELSSALQGFTSEFGMVSGGALAVLSPYLKQ